MPLGFLTALTARPAPWESPDSSSARTAFHREAQAPALLAHFQTIPGAFSGLFWCPWNSVGTICLFPSSFFCLCYFPFLECLVCFCLYSDCLSSFPWPLIHLSIHPPTGWIFHLQNTCKDPKPLTFLYPEQKTARSLAYELVCVGHLQPGSPLGARDLHIPGLFPNPADQKPWG